MGSYLSRVRGEGGEAVMEAALPQLRRARELYELSAAQVLYINFKVKVHHRLRQLQYHHGRTVVAPWSHRGRHSCYHQHPSFHNSSGQYRSYIIAGYDA